LPTLADVAGDGAEAPDGIDGLSFLPALLGDDEAGEKHEVLYWEMAGAQAIRHGDWKLVKNSPRRDGVTRRKKRTELFNLDIDPGELHDLAAQYPQKVRELEVEMANQRTESEDFPLVRTKPGK